MNCIDKVDTTGHKVNLRLFGTDENAPHRRMELMFLPCKPIRKTKKNRHRKDLCLAKNPKQKLREIKKYLNAPDMEIIYN